MSGLVLLEDLVSGKYVRMKAAEREAARKRQEKKKRLAEEKERQARETVRR